jgi:hypothetical protein
MLEAPVKLESKKKLACHINQKYESGEITLYKLFD